MVDLAHELNLKNLLSTAEKKRDSLTKQLTENDQLIQMLLQQLGRPASSNKHWETRATADSGEQAGPKKKTKVGTTPLKKEHIETVLKEGPVRLDEIVERLKAINEASRSTVHRFLTAGMDKWLIKTDEGYALKG